MFIPSSDNQFYLSPDSKVVGDFIKEESGPIGCNMEISAMIGKREKVRCVLMSNTKRMISDIGWSNNRPTSLPQETGLWILPLQPSIVMTPSTWKAAVATKCAEILGN